LEIIPAVDIRAGRCVRLYQGNFERERIFSEEPISVALNWQDKGASRLHIVDLDGARSGVPQNTDVIRAMVASLNIPVQVGGGIRTIEDCECLLEVGVDRVIFGTAAIQNHELINEASTRFGRSKIVVSIDSWKGRVAVSGWQRETEMSALELLTQMAHLGVERFVYTDISRDGTLTEPNFSGIQQLIEDTGLAFMVSGGVTTLQHLRFLTKMGVEGAIIGSALYTGNLNLREAIEAIASNPDSLDSDLGRNLDHK